MVKAIGAIVLLAGSVLLHAKETTTINIVDAASLTAIGSSYVSVPSTPSQSITNCNGISGIYSPQYGSTCVTTNYPGQPPHVEFRINGVSFLYAARGILSSGEKVFLMCTMNEKNCKSLEPKDSTYDDTADLRRAADLRRSRSTVMTERRWYNVSPGGLGVYKCERDGDIVVIHGPHGKSEYHIFGAWTDPQLNTVRSDALGIVICASNSYLGGDGVVVKSVDPQSFAASIGLHSGDVITGIGIWGKNESQEIYTLEDFNRSLVLLKSKETVVIFRSSPSESVGEVDGVLP